MAGSIFMLKNPPVPADIQIMNISSGLSVINFNGMAGRDSIYLWPAYNNGKVDRITPVIRETDSQIPYVKTSDADMEKIISANKHTVSAYGSYGQLIEQKPAVRPGLLFDAVV
jgi:hypothetical protein